MGQLRIGTSGWVYPHWRGIYYPEELPQKEWFRHFARDFDTVEINNTFYRLPKAETFVHWKEAAPPGFLYTFKASRFITHIKRLKDPHQALENFIPRARGAGETLGPILFQLPPRWSADVARLEAFLEALPRDMTSVFEFRDDRWHVEEVRTLLQRFGASFCIHDHGTTHCPEWITSPTVYLRFHGSAETPYTGGYSREFLSDLARQIVSWRSAGLDVFAYFNNDIGGHAFRNALFLKELLDAPPQPLS